MADPGFQNRYAAIQARDPFRWRQARQALRFMFLRNGINQEGAPEQIATMLDPAQEQAWHTQPPPRGYEPRVNPGCLSDPQHFDMHNVRRPWAAPGGQMPGLTDEKRQQAVTTVNEVTRKLHPIGFEYARTLGWGGQGLAALYYYQADDGTVKKAVAKIQFGSLSGAQRERTMVSKLRGQQHILQRLTADDLRLPYSPHVVQQALADERLTLFQFAKYGTLKSVLHRHGDPNAGPAGQRPFPNRALVEIFRCLAKACIDMQFPPPTGDGQPAAPIIHLDFEPSNLLFTGKDQPEHPNLPRLELGDFGIAVDAPLNFSSFAQATEWVWDLRWRAKPRWFLPEQFSFDWDYVHLHPLADNIDTYGPIAGHFGPPSNIYHVGLVMSCCITGCSPQLPSQPERGPFLLPDRRPWWTYGASALEEFEGSVDGDILDRVMMCLVEEPARRITAQELVAWADEKLSMPISGDEGLAEWLGANFTRAPEVSRADRPRFDHRIFGIDQINPFE